MGLIMKLDISVKDHAAGSSKTRFQYTFTGITEEGNRYVEDYTESEHRHRMEFAGKSLEHYCATGTMFKKTSLMKGLHSLLKHG